MTASAAQLVRHYQTILDDRMQGLPFVNDALEVAAVGFRDYDEHSIGVLISPWFMNLVLLPGTDEWSECEQGSIRRLELPGEAIEFNVCQDEELGTYLTAVLFTDSGRARVREAPRFSRRDFLSRLGTER